MSFRKVAAVFPLPICILFCFSLASFAQDDNPFGGAGQNDANPFGKKIDRQKLREQLQEYQQGQDREKDREKELSRLQMRLAEVVQRNGLLKSRVEVLSNANEEARVVAEVVKKNRNQMHQNLFETLLKSDDKSQQELALVHFFECVDHDSTAGSRSIDIYKPVLLRRVKQLVESDSDRVKQLASRCLFTTNPTIAIESGIQFAPTWRSLEFANAPDAKRRLFEVLRQDASFQYDDVPMQDVVDELQSDFRINVRLAAGVDAETLVSFDDDQRVRIADFLSSMLGSKKLDYVVSNGAIVVMNKGAAELAVTRNYNVRRLFNESVDIERVTELIEESVDGELRLGVLNEHVFWVKTNETNHLKVEQKLGALAPNPKWWWSSD